MQGRCAHPLHGNRQIENPGAIVLRIKINPIVLHGWTCEFRQWDETRYSGQGTTERDGIFLRSAALACASASGSAPLLLSLTWPRPLPTRRQCSAPISTKQQSQPNTLRGRAYAQDAKSSLATHQIRGQL
jgi:hypothetical protein